MSTTEPPVSLSVQQTDALWDAVAVPGPHPPSYPEQWERVCRTVARIIADLTPGDDETGTPWAATLSAAEHTMLTYALDQAQERIWAEDGFSDEDQAAVDSLRHLVNGPLPSGCTPRRGDQFETWLKAQRDASADHPVERQAADGLLELYRVHADIGTPLDQRPCSCATGTPGTFEGSARDCRLHGESASTIRTDAEIIEAAREIGMAEPEKAPEIVAASRGLFAQSGVDTPGCNCGHGGMGLLRHLKSCAWLAVQSVSHPDAVIAEEPEAEVRCGGCGHHEGEGCGCPSPVPGIRGLLEHVGIDTTGKDIRVGDRVVDAWPHSCGYTAMRCNGARTRMEHGQHDWEPQPGMTPLHCRGWNPEEATR